MPQLDNLNMRRPAHPDLVEVGVEYTQLLILGGRNNLGTKIDHRVFDQTPPAEPDRSTSLATRRVQESADRTSTSWLHRVDRFGSIFDRSSQFVRQRFVKSPGSGKQLVSAAENR